MAYSYYRSITIDYTKCGTADSTDFPVLVSVTDASFKTVANGGKVQNASGFDIAFYSDSARTTPLFWEIDQYDASSGATGTCSFWVKVPTLSATANTVIYVAYGDTSISSFQSTATSVWGSNYTTVLHLPNSTTLGLLDSTSNANNFTNNGATAISGKIYGGLNINGINQETNRIFTIPVSAGTCSFWARTKVNAGSTSIPIFICRNASPVNAFDMYLDNGASFWGWYKNGVDKRASFNPTGVISANIWYYYTLTWTNGGTTEIKVNATSKATTASLNATWNTSANTSYIGKDALSNKFANVDVDEFRIANFAASSSWITSEYNNQNSPSTFFTLGTETPTTPSTSTSNFFQFF